MYISTSRKSEFSENELRRQVRKNCKESLFYVARTVLGMSKLQAHLHLPFANFIQMYPRNIITDLNVPAGPPSSRRKLAWMPREHFKSSIISRALPIWLLIHDINTTIALVSAKHASTKKWLRWIENQVEYNTTLQWAFPEFKKGDKWDQEEMTLQRDSSITDDVQASVTAYSVKGGLASQHHQHGILDDLLNEQTAYSETERTRAQELYVHFESVLKGWHESTSTLVGTPWPGYDVIDHAMEHEVAYGERLFWGIGARGGFDMSPELKNPEYRLHNLAPAEPEMTERLERDNVIFVEECPEEKLQKIKRQDLLQYYYQYLCRKPDQEDNGFNIKLIRDASQMLDSGRLECDCHTTHEHRLDRMIVVMLVDPALSEDKAACESAIMVVARDPSCGCRFLLYEWGGRVNTLALLDQMCFVGMEWQGYLRRLGIEDVQFQRTLKFYMRERQSQGKFPRNVEIMGVSPKKRDKDLRILSQQPYVAEGLWHKRPSMAYDESTENWIWQVGKFPGQPKKRDRIDAWAYCDDVWEDIQPPRPAKGASTPLSSKNHMRQVRDLAKMRANQ